MTRGCFLFWPLLFLSSKHSSRVDFKYSVQHHLEKTVIIIILLTGIDGAYIPRVIVIFSWISHRNLSERIEDSAQLGFGHCHMGPGHVIITLIHMTTFAKDLFVYRYFSVCEEGENV